MKARLDKIINNKGKDEYLMSIINNDWKVVEKHVFDTIVINENVIKKPEPQSINWLSIFSGGVVIFAIVYFGFHALIAIL